MADSAVAVTAGSGTNIDTRTETTNGNHRQVVVLGDPETNEGVAPVDATNGLSVEVKAIAEGDNNIGNVDIVSLPDVTVVGKGAHDAAVSGNPILAGFEGRTTDGTAVTSGDAVRGLADTLGKQIVILGSVHDLKVSGKANYTNNTASDLIAASGAGVKIVVTSVLVTNAHATVSTKVEIRAGTTVKIQGYALAAGGGFTLSDPQGLFITSANEAVTGRAVTTGSDVDIFVSGYKIAN
jgi:hypothetical protein